MATTVNEPTGATGPEAGSLRWGPGSWGSPRWGSSATR